MKRWLWVILLIIAVFAVGWYYFFYPRTAKRVAEVAQVNAIRDQSTLQPATINWQPLDRQQNGFRLEMPAGAQELQVPAYTDSGSSEPVEMLLSNPDKATSFAVTWEDNPPVARANDRNPDRTLEAAREGMLTRTQTYEMTESQQTIAGFPAMDVLARNAGGGVLDARLIYAKGRLYALIATFPSMTARREEDVLRFYNSFTPQLIATGTKAGKSSS